MEDAIPYSPCVSLVEEVVEEIVEAVSPPADVDTDTHPESVSSGSKASRGSSAAFPSVKRRSNERERWRHHNVNDAFASLSTLLPTFPIHKKLKKKEILDRSIKYIAFLQTVLQAMENQPNVIHNRHKICPDTPDSDIENDTHHITLISSVSSSRLASHSSISNGNSTTVKVPHSDVSSDGSNYRWSNSPISPMTARPHDGADDWIADMRDSGYFY